jgi:hypothetical protein
MFMTFFVIGPRDTESYRGARESCSARNGTSGYVRRWRWRWIEDCCSGRSLSAEVLAPPTNELY